MQHLYYIKMIFKQRGKFEMAILDGLKILDFSGALPGPMATMIFADLGADVIRIESSRRLDLTRIMPPYTEEKESYIHQHLNRSKRSLTLNLKSKPAVEVIKKLILEYDVIVEGFRPGVMKRLGLDYETLKDINPKLIYCSITGYGQTGPYALKAGHDNNYLATAGVLDHARHADRKPVAQGIQIADIAGGTMHAAIGILAAALKRTQTGTGQAIDISMTDAAFTLNALYGTMYLGSGQEPKPEKEILNGGTYYDFYKTKDGRFFAVGSLEPQFRKKLCEALDIPEIIDNTFNDSPYTQERFKIAVTDAFCSKTYEEWLHVFDGQFDGCVEPVLTFKEACEHPQLHARNMLVEVPTENGIQIQIGSAFKFSDDTPNYKYVGAKIGQHNEEILQSLGYSLEEIHQLEEQFILR